MSPLTPLERAHIGRLEKERDECRKEVVAERQRNAELLSKFDTAMRELSNSVDENKRLKDDNCRLTGMLQTAAHMLATHAERDRRT